MTCTSLKIKSLFFVLQHLFDLTNKEEVWCSYAPLVEKALHIFRKHNSTRVERILNFNNQIQHLLHLIHLIHSSLVLFPDEDIPNERYPVIIPCASKLEEGGIKFRKRDDLYGTDFLSIKFEEGVIEIPTVEVWDKEKILFPNLKSFDQCYFRCKKYITM